MRTLGTGLFLLFTLALIPGTATAQVSISSPSIMEHQASPGESYTGTVLVQNTSDEVQEAKVYKTDYLTFANGTTSYEEPGSVPRSNAKWITIQPAYITIPPHRTVTVTYTVHVPRTSTSQLTGTYWSMVMVEGIPKGSAESRFASGARHRVNMGIVTRVRYAVQVVTDIGTSGSRTVKFANPKVLATAGGKHLQFDLVNTGERAYTPRISLELYTETGERVGARSASGTLMYPGTSLRQVFDLHALAGGRYRALVVVDTGGDDVFGAQFTITL